MAARSVVFLVFDGMKMLDVAGPAEVFAEATRSGADYRLRYVSISGEPVLTSVGTRFHVDGTAASVTEADTVVVSGGDDLPRLPIPAELVDVVRQFQGRTRRLVSICTGSFVLAAAGVLDGRRATTHWRHAGLLARAHPCVEVRPDAIFVEDDGVYTSAGVSAGMDLALTLVEQDHGPALARSVARSLVMFMQRPGGQSQFSAALETRVPRTSALRSVIELVAAQPALDYSARNLASYAGVSTRHLTRLFAAELHTSPAKFVERTRLDHAKAMLASGHGVAETARAVGFGSAETMRRVFVARFGVSPSQYRERFATTASAGRG